MSPRPVAEVELAIKEQPRLTPVSIGEPSDPNPERIILNDLITGGPTLPAANVGF